MAQVGLACLCVFVNSCKKCKELKKIEKKKKYRQKLFQEMLLSLSPV